MESAEATQNYLPSGRVHADLVRRVIGLDLVPAQLTERVYAEAIVDAFLSGAGVTAGTETDWTPPRASQAQGAVHALVRAAYARTIRQPNYRWSPVTLLQQQALPAVIHDKWAPFVLREWYGGGEKSAAHAASFDSESAEFRFAFTVDGSDQVAWWLRLYLQDGAFVQYPGGRYYPDFPVVDDDGVHWVIETKSDAAALNDRSVDAKRDAAETWADAVNESKSFGRWRYLLVTESDLAATSGWAGLVARLSSRQPISRLE